LIPQAVSQVLYPRLAETYGRSGNLDELIRMSWKPIALTAAGLIPVIGISWVVVRPLMDLLLPAYADAIPAMYWGLLLPFVAAFQPASVIFHVTRKQRLYASTILFGMAVYGLSLFLLARDDTSLTDFPQAMLIGRAAFMVVCYVCIWRLRSKQVEGS
jgi:hypothetical protein